MSPPSRQLQAENAALRERVQDLEAQLRARDARVAMLEEQVGATATRLAELEQDAQQRRRFDKAARTRQEEPAQPMRTRAPEQNRGRPLEPADTVRDRSQYERCPDCGLDIDSATAKRIMVMACYNQLDHRAWGGCGGDAGAIECAPVLPTA
jgi:hypothetical protein